MREKMWGLKKLGIRLSLDKLKEVQVHEPKLIKIILDFSYLFPKAAAGSTKCVSAGAEAKTENIT